MVFRQQRQGLVRHQEQQLVQLLLHTHPLLNPSKLTHTHTHTHRAWLLSMSAQQQHRSTWPDFTATKKKATLHCSEGKTLPIVPSLTEGKSLFVNPLHKPTEANYCILTACAVEHSALMPTMQHKDTRKREPSVMRGDSDTPSKSLLSCRATRALRVSMRVCARRLEWHATPVRQWRAAATSLYG